MKCRVLNPEERLRWDQFVADQYDSPAFQHSCCGDEYASGRRSAEILAVETDEGKLLAGCMAVMTNYHFLPRCSLLVDGGPLWASEESLSVLLDGLKSYGYEKNAIFLEINVSNWGMRTELFETHFQLLRRKGTFLIDVRRSEEELSARMSSGSRRNWRKAIKAKAYGGSSQDPAMSEVLWKHYEHTYERKELKLPGKAAFVERVSNMLAGGAATLYYAGYDDEMQNLALISSTGKIPRYLYGGSTQMEGHPATGQFMFRYMINDLREKGYEILDLGGAPGETLDASHPNYGVWRFKKELGGEYSEHRSELLFVYDRFFWPLYRGAKRVQSFFKKE